MADVSCHLPWISFEINVSNNLMKSCGRTPWVNLSNNFFNDSYFVNRRVEFLRGNRPLDCISCWRLEDNNQLSKRQVSNQRYAFNAETSNLTVQTPQHLTINLGNLCNLSCVYCDENYSSVWATEKKLHMVSDSNYSLQVDEYINSVISDNALKMISFIGGEVTIMPMFYYMLDKINKLVTHPAELVIFTNGMFNDTHLNKICEFIKENKHIKFYLIFSIEAIGKQAEFIRTKLQWTKFEDNFKKMHAFSLTNNMSIGIIPTLNLYCLEGFDKFLSWLDSFGQYKWVFSGINHIDNPPEMAIKTLGKHSSQLLNILPDYNNNEINKYVTKVIQFVDKFDNLPVENYSNIIEAGYITHGNRSHIDPSLAVPKLIKLIHEI